MSTINNNRGVGGGGYGRKGGGKGRGIGREING
jgi:hypothetical protein